VGFKSSASLHFCYNTHVEENTGLILINNEDTIEIEVSQRIASLNFFLGEEHSEVRRGYMAINKNGHVTTAWSTYKQKWASALTIMPMKKKQDVVAHTTIISYRVKLLDKENLYGGSKPIRDTLIRRGYLWDDRPACGDLSVWQKKCKKGEEKTFIKVVLDKTSS